MSTNINNIINLPDIMATINLFLTTKDIILFSIINKDIRKHLNEANSNINNFIVVPSKFHLLNNKTLLESIRKITSNIFRLFPKITRLKFQCNKKKLFDLDTQTPRSLQPFICRYLDFFNYSCNYFREKELNVFYESLLLIKNLRELSIPIKCDFELIGLGNFVNLYELEILYSAVSNNYLLNEINKLSKLQSLSLFQCTSINQNFINDLETGILNNLIKLDLTKCSNIRALNPLVYANLTNLTFLSFLWTNVRSYNGINLLINLTTLKLGYDNTSISDETLNEISELSKLRTLVLRKSENITINGLQKLTKLKKLETLDLFRCSYIFLFVAINDGNPDFVSSVNYGHGLRYIKMMSNLTYLNIGYCGLGNPNNTDNCLQYLPKSIKTLKIIEGIPLRTYKSLKHLTNLTYLDIRDFDCSHNVELVTFRIFKVLSTFETF